MAKKVLLEAVLYAIIWIYDYFCGFLSHVGCAADPIPESVPGMVSDNAEMYYIEG